MAKQQFDDLIQRLRVVLVCHKEDMRTDKVLLGRYIDEHDNDAFTALVARHGHAVWSICLGSMRDLHDAEDVFQATFLQLARTAHAIRSAESIRAWICRVATGTALKLRRTKAREARLNEQLRRNASAEAVEFEPDASKVWELVVEEMTKLPTRYREPLEHSLLLGQSYREAATELGCSHAAIQRRIERGQQMLRDQLQKRGVVLTAGSTMLGAFGIAQPATAMPSMELLAKTAEAALAFGAGQAVPGSAAALAGSVGVGIAAKGKLFLLTAILAVGAVGSVVWALAPGSHPVAGQLAVANTITPAPVEVTEKRDISNAASSTEVADGIARVGGRVVDANGNFIPGATVTVLAQRSPRPGEAGVRDDVLTQTVSDAEGRFSLTAQRSFPIWSLPERFIQVWACAPHYAPVGLRIPSRSDAAPMDIRLPRPDIIRGIVLGDDGNPVAGAAVSVFMVGSISLGTLDQFPNGDAPPQWPEPTKTREDGSFEIHGLNLDHGLRLQICDDRYALQRVGLCGDFTGNDVIVQMAPARILQGRVIGADTKKPQPGAKVVIQAQDAFGREVDTPINTQCDDQGVFQTKVHHLIRFRTYRISVFPPGGVPYFALQRTLNWPFGETRQNIEFELPVGVLIGGKVTDLESGRPLAGVHTRFLPDRAKLIGLPADALAASSGVTVSEADGTFRLVAPHASGHLVFHEPSGDYAIERFTLDANGFLPERQIFANKTIAIKSVAGAVEDEISVTLRRGTRIVGQVVDPDGRPVSEGIFLCQTMTSPADPSKCQPQLFKNGRFVLQGCEPGFVYPVLLLDPKNNLGAQVDLSVSAGAETVRVELQRCGEIEAHFYDELGRPVFGFSRSLSMVVPPPRRADFNQRVFNAGESCVLQMNEVLSYREIGPFADRQGLVSLRSLIPGVRYRFDQCVRQDGTQMEFEMSPGETQRHDFIVKGDGRQLLLWQTTITKFAATSPSEIHDFRQKCP